MYGMTVIGYIEVEVWPGGPPDDDFIADLIGAISMELIGDLFPPANIADTMKGVFCAWWNWHQDMLQCERAYYDCEMLTGCPRACSRPPGEYVECEQALTDFFMGLITPPPGPFHELHHGPVMLHDPDGPCTEPASQHWYPEYGTSPYASVQGRTRR